MNTILGIAVGVGVAIGLGIYYVRQSRVSAALGAKIREELGRAGKITLPDLVVRLGMTDGFLNRGRVMNVLNPMVSRGEIVQEEPAGTTMSNRLSVLSFRLKA